MSERNLTIFGVPNHAELPYATFGTTNTAGIVPAGFEASYLKTPEPSELARISTLDPKDTQWTWDFAAERSVIGLGLVNHNLQKGSQIRFISPVDNITYTYATAVPTSVVASSNVTGTHTNIDETISAPDGSSVVPTSTGVGWYIQLGFDAFASPRLGVDLACVVLKSKRITVSGTEILTPKLTVDLYESGVFKKALGYRAPRSTASGGQIYIFSFDFSDLTTTSGANLEIRVSGLPGVNSIGGISSYCNIEVLNVYYESTFQYPTPFENDSGWITIETDDNLSSNISQPTKSNHYVPQTAWNSTAGAVVIRSDQSDHETLLSGGGSPVYNAVSDSVTFIQAGGAPIGDGLTCVSGGLTVDGSGPSSGIEVQEVSGYTIGGQSYGANSWRRRFTPPLNIVVNRDELLTLQEIFWTRGNSSPIYVVLEPDVAANYQKFTSFWCTIKELGTPVRIVYNAGPGALYRVDISFEEKL